MNPTGTGGFKDHPDHINRSGRPDGASDSGSTARGIWNLYCRGLISAEEGADRLIALAMKGDGPAIRLIFDLDDGTIRDPFDTEAE